MIALPSDPGLDAIRRVLNPAAEATPGRAAATPAAVLIPLVADDAGLQVLLTTRTEHLHHHAGQVSFPGGRVETEDLDPVHTALRESQEEIGLDPAGVRVIGFLDEYHTGTGFRVTPVVGYLKTLPRLRLDHFEVAEVFQVPLGFFMNPSNRERQSVRVQGRRRNFFVYRYDSRTIWGATAEMLVDLCRRVNPESA